MAKKRPARTRSKPRRPPEPALAPRVTLYADIVVHAPGKQAGVAICGLPRADMPAGPVELWGRLFEREQAVEGMLADLDMQLARANLAITGTGHATACAACLANLRRMLVADGRRIARAEGNGLATAAAGAGADVTADEDA